MAYDLLGADANYPHRYKCSRVKNIKETPTSFQKKYAQHQRNWNKYVAKIKKLAVDAIFSLVEDIDLHDAEAVVEEISKGQIPHVSLNIFGALKPLAT